MILALDTETTGLDLRHGALPFYVTTCTEEGNQFNWEFHVDPLTRKPQMSEEDISDVQEIIRQCDTLVGQNIKFDYTALRAADPRFITYWDWDKVEDTLVAAHVLGSNHQKNLTDLAMTYLQHDIEPAEKNLNRLVEECRRLCRSKLPTWCIAKEGLEGMPSAKERCWKFDTWLPRAVASHLGYEQDHPYWTALAKYANEDSGTTLALWLTMEQELHRRGLWEIYRTKMKLVPIMYDIEDYGITTIGDHLQSMRCEYHDEAERCGRVCVNIAASLGYELQMPKGASPNNSLRTFMFDGLKVPHIYDAKAKSDAPTLNKHAMEEYLVTLPPNSKGQRFVSSIMKKRARDTSLTFMNAYERFWKPVNGVEGYYKLHPRVNITGTDTTRFSSEDPNSQNVSKRGVDVPCPLCQGDDLKCGRCHGEGTIAQNIRYCFGPAPGREWWSLDAKNIELRIPFYKCGDQTLINLFERPDDPPFYGSNHLMNFSVIYADIWEKELKEVGIEKVGPHCKKKYASTWYQWCKNGDFAIQYQAGDRTADMAFHRPGARRMLLATFQKLDAYNLYWCKFAEKHGYVETLPDKTVNPKHGYPLLCTRTEYGRIKPTIPLSYVIQGTAGWWMYKALIRCHKKLQDWNSLGFDGHIVATVHDELVFDFPKRGDPTSWDRKNDSQQSRDLFRATNLWRIEIIRRLMEQGGDDIGVPTPVSCEFHSNNWSEGVSF